MDHFNLEGMFDAQGYVCIEKGMYGCRKPGAILANELMEKRLARHGYYKCTHTPGLVWKHRARPAQFALVVDDFSVQYVGKGHAQHLFAALRQDYEAVTADWEGTLFCGITLKGDYYDARTVELSMPGLFMHCTNSNTRHPCDRKTPHTNIISHSMESKTQLTDPFDDTPELPEEGKTGIHQRIICGRFLYYARAVEDGTMLVSLKRACSTPDQCATKVERSASIFILVCAAKYNLAFIS